MRFERTRWIGHAAGVVLWAGCAGLTPKNESRPLFDGETLAGWSIPDAEAHWWSVQDGALTGGSLEVEVPHNTFLETTESFQDFDLTFQIRIRSTGGFANSGIQIRSRRVPGGSEVHGFQVDVGDGYGGDLYDEGRRGRVFHDGHLEALLDQITHV